MDKKKKGILPRIEVIIIIVFFLSFVIWAISKCSARKNLAQQIEVMQDSIAIQDSLMMYGATPKPLPQDENTGTKTGTTESANKEPEFTKLYVTIDKLKLRTGPSLDSTVIYEFPLFEQVYFMNEVTDSTTKLSLGKEIADEPWVKVKSNKGKVGWVYGAGVHYHKKKREGVQ